MLLDFADFAWLEQPEGNLMDAISRVWDNGSYTIAAKPITTLEFHYTMIQFLIMRKLYKNMKTHELRGQLNRFLMVSFWTCC